MNRGWWSLVVSVGMAAFFGPLKSAEATITFTKGSSGDAAHQFRNPCKVSVTTATGVVVDRNFFVGKGEHAFQVTIDSAPGWNAVRARYRDLSGNQVILPLSPGNVRRFSFATSFAVSGNVSLVTVEFETYRRTPSGSPDYRENITVNAVAMQDLAQLDWDNDRLPDLWEFQWFGTVGFDSDGDFDRDGASNLEEYLNGTDPTDFWNGQPAVLRVVGKRYRGDLPGSVITPPLKVKLTNNLGTPVPGKTVTFSILSGGGTLQGVQGTTTAAGEAETTLVLPSSVGEPVKVRARYLSNYGPVDQTFTATIGDVSQGPSEAPSGTKVTMSSDETAATVTWIDRSDNETAFYVDRTTDYLTWTRRATLPRNSTSFTDTGLTPRTLYIYRIIAHNDAP